MNSLRLLVTDTSFLLSEKGKTISQKTFSSEEESFALLTEVFKPLKYKKIDCFFSGSHLASKTIIVRHEEPEAFVADQGLVDKLVINAHSAFLQGREEEKLEIVTSKVLTMSLNGYEVPAFNKSKVNSVQVSVFIVALPSLYKKKLLALVDKKGSECTLDSFAKSLMEKIIKHGEKPEFIVCSAYERSTDISVRKANGFFETLTIPIGTHHVLGHIAKGLNLDEDTAAVKLSLYNEGKLEESSATNMEAAILSFQMSLDEALKKALAGLSEGISLPGKVYLLISPEFKKAYEAAFKSDSYHSLCFTDCGFEVADMSSILSA
jgi:hypothetical protein